MKNIIFKFLDTFYYAELIKGDEDPTWFEPSSLNESFGYSSDNNILYYDENLKDEVCNIFNVENPYFKRYFGEWFEERYKLPVNYII
jgi:hypothetical protein